MRILPQPFSTWSKFCPYQKQQMVICTTKDNQIITTLVCTAGYHVRKGSNYIWNESTAKRGDVYIHTGQYKKTKGLKVYICSQTRVTDKTETNQWSWPIDERLKILFFKRYRTLSLLEDIQKTRLTLSVA